VFIDSRKLQQGYNIQCDVCIIGGGPAGIIMAHELSNSGLKIALLESGGIKLHSATQDLDVGEVLDPTRHAPPHLYRQRRLGGTLNVWGGRCVPFDELDFEARTNLPFSGWPFSKSDLDSYYKRAHNYLELGDYKYVVTSALPGNPKPLISGLKSELICSEKLWRFSRSANVMNSWTDMLKRSQHVNVYLYATCLKLITNDIGNEVVSLIATSLERNEIDVTAQQYVIAAGGLETPRILLVSNDVHSEGMGNKYDLVGRFYMSHLHGIVGHVEMTPMDRATNLGFEMTAEGVYTRRMLSISEAAQTDRRLLNFSACLNHPVSRDPMHKSGVLSTRYLKELWFPQIALKRSIRRRANTNRMTAQQAFGHVQNIVLDAPQVLRYFGERVFDKIRHRKSYYFPVTSTHSSSYLLTIDAEQAPNPDSRVFLGDDKDIFGIRRLKIDWRVTDADVESVLTSCGLLASELKRSNVGKFRYDPRIVPSRYVTRSMGGHHMGTTRMAQEPSLGVVDENCRVHGVGNLHIASSSVFPTSGCANPTLTEMALTIRLADHLKLRFLGDYSKIRTHSEII